MQFILPNVKASLKSFFFKKTFKGARQQVPRQINEQLTQELKPLGFIVEKALLRNVIMPDTIQTAIQEKLKAEQENQRMKFVLEKQRPSFYYRNRQVQNLKAIAQAEKLEIQQSSGMGILAHLNWA